MIAWHFPVLTYTPTKMKGPAISSSHTIGGAPPTPPGVTAMPEEATISSTENALLKRTDGHSLGALSLKPCSIQDARQFIGQHHRHSLPPVSGLFAVAVALDGKTVGVGIAGRPVSRVLADGLTVEITRVATNGARNACSMIYGALCRAARALGYKRAVTYTLESEHGASLRASGWVVDGKPRRGGTGTPPSRPRMTVDLFGNTLTPPGAKVRWARKAR